ncbi:ATP-binding cassette domain-containing protein [Streptomyces sp. L7]
MSLIQQSDFRYSAHGGRRESTRDPITGVSKEFTHRRGRVEALQGIDLEAGDGEFVAVVGRSGCGKSTLLRLIAGLAVPTRGEVLMGGRAVTGPRPTAPSSSSGRPCCRGGRCWTMCCCLRRSRATGATARGSGRWD